MLRARQRAVVAPLLTRSKRAVEASRVSLAWLRAGRDHHGYSHYFTNSVGLVHSYSTPRRLRDVLVLSQLRDEGENVGRLLEDTANEQVEEKEGDGLLVLNSFLRAVADSLCMRPRESMAIGTKVMSRALQMAP